MFTSVYTTIGSEHEAKEIAKNLMDQKLIACANMFPINSLYFWDGKLQDDCEFAIIMKTRFELVEELITELTKIHSYDVPCIVCWEISKGNENYLSWIIQETRKPIESSK